MEGIIILNYWWSRSSGLDNNFWHCIAETVLPSFQTICACLQKRAALLPSSCPIALHLSHPVYNWKCYLGGGPPTKRIAGCTSVSLPEIAWILCQNNIYSDAVQRSNEEHWGKINEAKHQGTIATFTKEWLCHPAAWLPVSRTREERCHIFCSGQKPTPRRPFISGHRCKLVYGLWNFAN